MEKNDEFISDEEFIDYGLGCLLGAMCGDSVGSWLEFNMNPTDAEIAKALEMPGGGPHSLASGQLTDDTELALALAQGLINGKGKLSLDQIASQYCYWIVSKPFDLGRTTSNAFLDLPRDPKRKEDDCKGLAKLCIESSKKLNTESESNGALMRIAPLAIWCSQLSDEDLAKAVAAEITLTHPSSVIHEAGVAYCLVIKHLLNNPRDMSGAYKKLEEYVKKSKGKEITEWFEAVKAGDLPNCTKQIGWAKIAWCYSMYYLKEERTDFKEVIRDMMSKGGDTDTNACIVGAVIGTAIGKKALPKEWLDILLTTDVSTTIKGRKRDKRYNASNAWFIIEQLYSIRPKKLVFA